MTEISDKVRREAERKLAQREEAFRVGMSAFPPGRELLDEPEEFSRVAGEEVPDLSRENNPGEGEDGWHGVDQEALSDWEQALLDDEDDWYVLGPAVLDHRDPFDAVLIHIVETNRRKRADYTGAGESPWSNFDRTESQCNLAHGQAVEVLIATKQARLAGLLRRDGEPLNEAVEDTLLDRAVYSIIALARSRYPDGTVG